MISMQMIVSVTTVSRRSLRRWKYTGLYGAAARKRPSVSGCALVERVIGEPLASIRP
jgi:hypothetical protein